MRAKCLGGQRKGLELFAFILWIVGIHINIESPLSQQLSVSKPFQFYAVKPSAYYFTPKIT